MNGRLSAPLAFALVLVRAWTLLCVLAIVRGTEGTLARLADYLTPTLSLALGTRTHEWENLLVLEMLSLLSSILGTPVTAIPHDLLSLLHVTQGVTRL